MLRNPLSSLCLSLLLIIGLFSCSKDNAFNPDLSSEEQISTEKNSTNRFTPYNDEWIPLVVILYEHTDFGGVRRYVINDYSDFSSSISFNDETSSISVHKGPNYYDYKSKYGHEPTVTFYEHSNVGQYITLGVGHYSSLDHFNNRISSCKFYHDRSITVAPDMPENIWHYKQIKLVTRAWKHSYSGWHLVFLTTGNPSLDRIDAFYHYWGPGTNDQISSLSVTKGPNWYSGVAIKFWQHNYYSGQFKTFEAGNNIGFLSGYNDMFSSSESIN